jgi:hypothetical protein
MSSSRSESAAEKWTSFWRELWGGCRDRGKAEKRIGEVMKDFEGHPRGSIGLKCGRAT